MDPTFGPFLPFKTPWDARHKWKCHSCRDLEGILTRNVWDTQMVATGNFLKIFGDIFEKSVFGLSLILISRVRL